MNTFDTKSYGRIYVDKESSIKKVKEIIKQIDEFEYEYLPDNFIAVFDEYPKLVFTGKFDDLDIVNLTRVCFQMGVFIFCVKKSDLNE